MLGLKLNHVSKRGPLSQRCIYQYVAQNCNVLKVNTLGRPRQNGCHFAYSIFKCIFLKENVWNLIRISLNFVPKGPINNVPAMGQTMAWHQIGVKPLSELMQTRFTDWNQKSSQNVSICNVTILVTQIYTEMGTDKEAPTPRHKQISKYFCIMWYDNIWKNKRLYPCLCGNFKSLISVFTRLWW